MCFRIHWPYTRNINPVCVRTLFFPNRLALPSLSHIPPVARVENATYWMQLDTAASELRVHVTRHEHQSTSHSAVACTNITVCHARHAKR